VFTAGTSAGVGGAAAGGLAAGARFAARATRIGLARAGSRCAGVFAAGALASRAAGLHRSGVAAGTATGSAGVVRAGSVRVGIAWGTDLLDGDGAVRLQLDTVVGDLAPLAGEVRALLRVDVGVRVLVGTGDDHGPRRVVDQADMVGHDAVGAGAQH